MELPISIFYGSIAFFMSLPLLGFILRMQIPISVFMFASGSLMLVLLLSTTSLNVQENPEQRITTYNSTTIIQNKEPFDFSLEGDNYQLKVFWIIVSVLLIVGGALIEIRSRN